MSLNPILQKIKTDVANGRNVNMVICGAPRTGKSWSALRLAELLDDSFTTDRVVWTIPQFMNLMMSKTLKDGSAVIFDEAGVSVSNRNWYEKMNKDFMFIMQTYGYRHLIVIMTTPSMSYIDTASRRLFNYFLETWSLDTRRGTCMLKVRHIQHNPQTGKTYYKSPIAGGWKAGRLIITAPSQATRSGYEVLSEMWKNELSKEIEKSTADSEAKNDSVDDAVAKIIANADGFTKEYKGRKFLNLAAIRRNLKLSYSKAQETKEIAEKALGLPINIQKGIG